MRPDRLPNVLRRIWSQSSRTPALSVIYSVIVAILYNALSQLLNDLVGPFLALLGSLALIILLGLAFWAFVLRRQIELRSGQKVEAKKGLIVLVSPGKFDESVALGAIRHHFRGEHDERPVPTLECLWLLHSEPPETPPSPPFQSSHQNALQLEAQFQPLIRHVQRLEIHDADDPEEVFYRAEDAYRRARRLGLTSDDLIADITGGTKSMTIGLAFAGIPISRDLQFMKPRAYTPTGHAVASAGADARRIDVNWVAETPSLGTP